MKSPIRILFPLYLDHWAAINTVHREVAKRLPDEFHVTGLTGNGSEVIDESLYDTLIEIPNTDSTVRRAVDYLRLYDSKYDIVQTWGSISDNLALLSKARGARIVHTMHSGNPDQISRRALVRQASDHTVCVSEYVQELAYGGRDLASVSVIPNAVDFDLFSPELEPTKSNLLTYVGKGTKNKHPELIIKLAQEYTSYQFQILGPQFEPGLLNLKIPNNVDIRGHLPRTTVAAELSKSSVVLCPYENESFCMAALEALASDTPVVALSSANLPYLVTPDAGVLCENISVETWKQAINLVYEEYNSFSPRQTVTEYNWDTVSSQYSQLYKQVFHTH